MRIALIEICNISEKLHVMLSLYSWRT